MPKKVGERSVLEKEKTHLTHTRSTINMVFCPHKIDPNSLVVTNKFTLYFSHNINYFIMLSNSSHSNQQSSLGFY